MIPANIRAAYGIPEDVQVKELSGGAIHRSFLIELPRANRAPARTRDF